MIHSWQLGNGNFGPTRGLCRHLRLKCMAHHNCSANFQCCSSSWSNNPAPLFLHSLKYNTSLFQDVLNAPPTWHSVRICCSWTFKRVCKCLGSAHGLSYVQSAGQCDPNQIFFYSCATRNWSFYEQAKSHGIWFFHFGFGPLSYVVQIRDTDWIFLNATSVWTLRSELMQLWRHSRAAVVTILL